MLSFVCVGVSACTLGSAIAAQGCSTAIATGLTQQIAAEMTAMGLTFKSLDSSAIRCTSPCFPQMRSQAADSLAAVARSKSQVITLNSAFRSSAQQFLLYRWAALGQCGYNIVAKPGTSNHEAGLACDVSSWSTWKPALTASTWKWYGTGDEVHFDYTGTGSSTGHASDNLKAFQRLWNRANPTEKISEDGAYGPATESALNRAPCDGFPTTTTAPPVAPPVAAPKAVPVAPPPPKAPPPVAPPPVASSTSSLCTTPAGVRGVCRATSTCTGGTTTSGLCPGSADIRCCTYPATCGTSGGVCLDSAAYSCNGGTWASGLCPGPAGIKCCVPSSTTTPVAAPKAVPPPPPKATPVAPPPPVASGTGYLPPAPVVPAGAASCTFKYSSRAGHCITRSACTGATVNGLCSGSNVCCAAETVPAPAAPQYVSLAVFNSLFTGISGARRDAMWPYFNAALQEGGITSCNCKAAFIAQVGHESGGLMYFEELASGSAYEGRTDLGNTQPGDGMKFKGRGPIQLTGRSNYQAASNALSVSPSLTTDPERVCFPSMGFRTTVWFWTKNNLNRYCESGTNADFETLTRRINGGTNGLADRQARWHTALSKLGC